MSDIKIGNRDTISYTCLFLYSGRTFTFKDIHNLIDNETIISFTYTDMSDNLRKNGTFYKTQIVGKSNWLEYVRDRLRNNSIISDLH